MIKNLVYIDQISMIILFLITVVGMSIISFSSRYMKGDLLYTKFLVNLCLLITSASCMAVSNHIVLFLLFWCLSNFLLVRLMIHKPFWRAALESGLLAQRYFIYNFLLLNLALTIFAWSAGSGFIHEIVTYQHNQMTLYLAGVLMIVAAMIQSALWPFQSWLLSSLNSPTPVSAMMHAGLINGGGFLLIRFFPLLSSSSFLLQAIFIAGFLSVLLGSIWKLLQHDIKRMLACSTMSQMGFMFMQYGLGFASAALAHIVLHGFLKAYLFLRSASVVTEKRLTLSDRYSFFSAVAGFLIAVVGSAVFILASDQTFCLHSTYLVLLAVTFIASLQMSLTIMGQDVLKNGIVAFLLVILGNGVYGLSIRLLEEYIHPLNLARAQPLGFVHLLALLILLLVWAVMITTNFLEKYFVKYACMKKWYVLMLNWSQPEAPTVTGHKNNYRYK